jgi:hypothetical protein
MRHNNTPNTMRLTVCDHEQNGVVHLALWRFSSEADARSMIERIDRLVEPEAEPDWATALFAFVLDLVSDDGECHDTGHRIFPTQIAQRLAPAQVEAWLQVRRAGQHRRS